MRSIGEAPAHCIKCDWRGTVYDCEPDIDGDGSLGCPQCATIINVVAKAPHPMQPVETDLAGVLRFKANDIVRYLLDNGPFDLKGLAALPFNEDDWSQFAQLIDYSVSDYLDLRYISEKSKERINHLYYE